jgi:hypothetical protein
MQQCRLVDLPTIPNPMPAGPGSLSQQRREPLHPSVDADVVDLDAALGEEFLDVAVGEAEAQVPADRQHDHLRWEAEAGEGRPWDGSGTRAASSHGDSLAAPAPQHMQQRRSGRHGLFLLDPSIDANVRHLEVDLGGELDFLVVTRSIAWAFPAGRPEARLVPLRPRG